MMNRMYRQFSRKGQILGIACSSSFHAIMHLRRERKRSCLRDGNECIKKHLRERKMRINIICLSNNDPSLKNNLISAYFDLHVR